MAHRVELFQNMFFQSPEELAIISNSRKLKHAKIPTFTV